MEKWSFEYQFWQQRSVNFGTHSATNVEIGKSAEQFRNRHSTKINSPMLSYQLSNQDKSNRFLLLTDPWQISIFLYFYFRDWRLRCLWSTTLPLLNDYCPLHWLVICVQFNANRRTTQIWLYLWLIREYRWEFIAKKHFRSKAVYFYNMGSMCSNDNN